MQLPEFAVGNKEEAADACHRQEHHGGAARLSQREGSPHRQGNRSQPHERRLHRTAWHRPAFKARRQQRYQQRHGRK